MANPVGKMTLEELEQRRQMYPAVPSPLENLQSAAKGFLAQSGTPAIGRGGARRGSTVQPTAPVTQPIAMPTSPVGQAPQMDTLGAQPTGIFPQAPAAAETPATPSIFQMPSMDSVGLPTLTTEPAQGGLAATPSLQPQAPTISPDVQATRERLGAMFGEGPQTVTQLTTGIEGAVMAPDAQGRLRTYESQEAANQALQAGLSAYGQESAAREARLEATLADRAAAREAQRGGEGGGISDADARDLSALRDPQATESQRARAMQVAERLGRDPLTGQALTPQGSSGLTEYQKATLAQKDREFNYEALQDEYRRLEQSGKQQEQDKAAYESVMDNTERLGKMANEAIGLTLEPGTTGWSGALLKFLPGSNANQLKEVLAVVQSDVALTRLANLKATGATLGQISKPELDMLQNSFDALKQNLKGERLREALVNYSNQLQNIESKVSQAYESKYGAQSESQQAGPSSSANQVDYKGSNYEIVQ